MGRQKPKDKRQDHPQTTILHKQTSEKEGCLLPLTMNPTYPSLPSIRDSNDNKKSDERIILTRNNKV